MSENSSPRHSTIERFFRGLAESIFQTRLGVADVEMVDYLSDMLLRFVRSDTIYRVRRGTGRPATEVFAMLSEAEKRMGLAKREVHRHIGDFTLFWSGMYPESLRKTPEGESPSAFLAYCDHGKRSYRIASQIEGGQDRPPCEVLFRLSEQFEMCAYGLREVRRQWEEDEPGTELLV
ncbi:MAG: hypothetical protein AAF958_00945 [Planctomycetota bacterium]